MCLSPAGEKCAYRRLNVLFAMTPHAWVEDAVSGTRVSPGKVPAGGCGFKLLDFPQSPEEFRGLLDRLPYNAIAVPTLNMLKFRAKRLISTR
jgi:hypothetical protein